MMMVMTIIIIMNIIIEHWRQSIADNVDESPSYKMYMHEQQTQYEYNIIRTI